MKKKLLTFTRNYANLDEFLVSILKQEQCEIITAEEGW
jgi:hypothetical protein